MRKYDFKIHKFDNADSRNDFLLYTRNNDKYYLAVESLLYSIKDNETLEFELALSKINLSKNNYSKQLDSYQQLSNSKKDKIKRYYELIIPIEFS